MNKFHIENATYISPVLLPLSDPKRSSTTSPRLEVFWKPDTAVASLLTPDTAWTEARSPRILWGVWLWVSKVKHIRKTYCLLTSFQHFIEGRADLFWGRDQGDFPTGFDPSYRLREESFPKIVDFKVYFWSVARIKGVLKTWTHIITLRLFSTIMRQSDIDSKWNCWKPSFEI